MAKIKQQFDAYALYCPDHKHVYGFARASCKYCLALGADDSWKLRHNQAVDAPRGFEIPIVRMLHFWEMYAAEHQKRFESPIGEDYVLGPEWQQIGEGIRGLLNGESGRLDCGTLDGYILQTMREQGFTRLSGGDVL